MYTSVRIIDEENAWFTCNHCHEVVRVATSDCIHQPNHTFDLACSCGHLNKSVIEHRTSIRKKTNIAGIYKVMNEAGAEKTGSMTVKNISWQGFQLNISGEEHCIKEHDLHCDRYNMQGHNYRSIFVQNLLKVGERIIIEFFLDDSKWSFISKPVIIKWLRNHNVGVVLNDPAAFEPSIRFYLLGLKTHC
jgi:hypothetical protein